MNTEYADLLHILHQIFLYLPFCHAHQNGTSKLKSYQTAEQETKEKIQVIDKLSRYPSRAETAKKIIQCIDRLAAGPPGYCPFTNGTLG